MKTWKQFNETLYQNEIQTDIICPECGSKKAKFLGPSDYKRDGVDYYRLMGYECEKCGHVYNVNLQKNEKYGEVKFSELDNNWSAYYHLSTELSDAKAEYRELGKDGFIKKIVNIVKQLDEGTFKNLMRKSSEYRVNLPDYNRATDEKYWHGRFGQISALVVIMGALTSGLEVEKDRIREQINELNQKLASLDGIF